MSTLMFESTYAKEFNEPFPGSSYFKLFILVNQLIWQYIKHEYIILCIHQKLLAKKTAKIVWRLSSVLLLTSF